MWFLMLFKSSISIPKLCCLVKSTISLEILRHNSLALLFPLLEYFSNSLLAVLGLAGFCMLLLMLKYVVWIVLRLWSILKMCGFELTAVILDSFTSMAIQSFGFAKSTPFLNDMMILVSFIVISPVLSSLHASMGFLWYSLYFRFMKMNFLGLTETRSCPRRISNP